MVDHSELKRSAKRVIDIEASDGDEPVGEAWDQFESAATPSVVLALIAENEALAGLLKRFVDGEHEQGENQAERHMYFTEAQSLLALVSGELEAHTIVPDSAIKAIHVERDQFRAENAGLRTGYEAYEQVNAGLKADYEVARMRIKEMDLLFGRYILAMRSALIEEEHGKGPAAAMEWVYNSLAGPGELPPEGETDSQAYFDREIVAVDDGMQEVMAFHDGRRAAMGKGEQS